MKAGFWLGLGMFILSSCAQTITPYTYTLKSEAPKFQIVNIDDLLQEAAVKGVVLIYDEKNNQYYSNDYLLAKTRYLPASTFKIPNTLIALQWKEVTATNVFKWSGEPHPVEAWNQDLTFRDAFQYSCVPCYQSLARSTGYATMKNALEELGYPGMEFDSETIDLFWLKGASAISPLEQVDFLKRINIKATPVTDTTLAEFKEIALVTSAEKGDFYAKTGLHILDDESAEGWYVGWIEKPDNRIYFATHLTASEDSRALREARISITQKQLNRLYYW